jgi:formate dehydrogenase subunit delta
MSQTTTKLVYMANQISTAFRHQEPDKAAAATYDHLWHFWDPRMRRLIVAHLQSGATDLNPVAAAAVERLAVSQLEPQPVTQATEFTTPGDGDMAADAG